MSYPSNHVPSSSLFSPLGRKEEWCMVQWGHILDVRQLSREREKKIYSHNAGNQKGFSPSKLVPITNNLTKNMLDQIAQNVQT